MCYDEKEIIMTTSLYILLVVDTIIAFILLYLFQIPFKKINNKFLLFFLFLIKCVLLIYLGLALIAFDYSIVWNHEYPFAALYLVLVPDTIKDIICFILSLFKKEKSNKFKIGIALTLTIIFTLYNVINMQTIIANYHKISSSKLKHEYRLIFFSDLHYGSSQSQRTVDKALDDIKNLNPDYLLLGGDITDENTTKEELQYLYKKISSLNIPTYFIYGNHDRQERAIAKYGARTYSEEELESTILSNNIKILYENFEEINDDLILLGREDPSHPDKRKQVKDLPQFSKDKYVLVVDHTPYQDEEIKELNADLQFSGHTHAAQFFPIKTIYEIIGLNVFGDYYIGNTHLYVSSGIAGWGLPLRSEKHCNYEVIDLLPE